MRTLFFLALVFSLSTLILFGQSKNLQITGKLLNESGNPIQGEVFLDTALNKVSMLIQDLSSPPRSTFESGNVLIPVKADGTFDIHLNSVKPYYIHFIAPGKRSVSMFFPQTDLTQVTLKATLFKEAVKDDSEPAIETNSHLINQYIRVFSLSNISANTEVRRQMDASINWRIKNGTSEGFKYDLSNYYNKMLAIYNEATDRELKNYVLLNLSFLCVGNKYQVEEKYLKEAVKETPANGYLWVVDDSFVRGVYQGLGGLGKNKDMIMTFVDALATHARSQSVRAGILMTALADAHNGQLPEFYIYYNRLIKEYPQSTFAKNALKRYGSNKVIEGIMIPDFSITNIDKPTESITSETLKGKVWIIDFWATWCGPCVKQLPYVEALYNKYKDNGLGVFSVSVDQDMETVNVFRDKKFNMPWLNGFAGVKSTMAASFEVFAVPRIILVDKEGRVITVTQNDLEGEMLEKTVSKYLNP